MSDPNRFPRSVFGSGIEPDPRFSLANERTFLAWIRTALALIAAGVAVEAVGLPIIKPLQTTTSVLVILAGMLCAGQAWWAWTGTERALRTGSPLPAAPVKAPLAVLLVFAGLTLLVGLLL